MKKHFISALVVSALASSVASANTGEVRFIGSVTSETCKFTTQVNGAVKDTIDLGTMSEKDTQGKPVAFSLVPDDAKCLNKTNGVVGWQSSGFSTTGLANMNGTAKNVSIQLKALNSNPINSLVTSNNQNVTFGGDGNSTAINTLDFEANMVVNPGQKAEVGSVLAVATYAVAYK